MSAPLHDSGPADAPDHGVVVGVEGPAHADGHAVGVGVEGCAHAGGHGVGVGVAEHARAEGHGVGVGGDVHAHGDGHDHAHGDGGSCGADPVGVAIRLAPGERAAAVARARLLNRVSLAWNVVEGVIALVAGIAAGSVSLIGFGIDSGIEVSAALILAWRLHQERRGGCMEAYDRMATRLIAVAFVALAAYVWIDGVTDLVYRSRPEASIPGLLLAVVSVILMPWLARAKRALAPALGSQAVVADAQQTSLCALLSAVLIVGVGLNALAGWWWADPVAALVIGALALEAGRRVWRAETLADTCCG